MKRALNPDSPNREQQVRVRGAQQNPMPRQDPVEEQARDDARVVARDPEPNQALMEVLQAPPSNGVNRAWPRAAFVPAWPVVIMREHHLRQLNFPGRVWHEILAHLDEQDLHRLGQTCSELQYFANDQAAHALLDPASALGKKQMEICREKLYPILRDYRVQCDQQYAYVDVTPLATEYGKTLHRLASNLRCLDVTVHDGFESVVEGALSAATRWQFIRIQFGENADTSLVSRLEHALAVRNRQCSIDLFISGLAIIKPADWRHALPDGRALKLNALHLSDVQYDELGNLAPLLKSTNAITSFKISGEDTPDPIFPWLQEGSHDLNALHLDDGPEDGKPLVEILKKKAKLSSFALANADFKPDNLTLADILLAAPKLERLKLVSVTFEEGASNGSAQALKRSSLVEITLEGCSLMAPSGTPDTQIFRVTTAHKELLHGLRCAPHLETLGIGLGTFPGNASLFLRAFYMNPSARYLRARAFDTSELPALLEQPEAMRARLRLVPIQFEIEPDKPQAPSFGLYGSKFVNGVHESLNRVEEQEADIDLAASAVDEFDMPPYADYDSTDEDV